MFCYYTHLSIRPRSLHGATDLERNLKMNSILLVPEQLVVDDANRCRIFDAYEQAWSNYNIALGLEAKELKQILATLLAVVGNNALGRHNTFEWGHKEAKQHHLCWMNS